MSEALTLTIMGMSIVFAVLIIIFGSIVLLNWLEKYLPAPAVAGGPAPGPAAPVSRAITPEEEAAVHAAMAHHLQRAPETIHVRITPANKE